MSSERRYCGVCSMLDVEGNALKPAESFKKAP